MQAGLSQEQRFGWSIVAVLFAAEGLRAAADYLRRLRARMSVLFQQPMRFNATVHDNIAWGNLAGQPGRGDVVAAAAAAGATELIERLPRQYEQLLGKWYASGTELSVGQWQRLALARAFLRRADVLILDEPTSAMDPWAEADWLQRFKGLAAGRTVLLITHRFTSAMYADVIHVLVEGQVVESGSHEQLIAAGGRYAGSWLQQRRAAPPGPRIPGTGQLIDTPSGGPV